MKSLLAGIRTPGCSVSNSFGLQTLKEFKYGVLLHTYIEICSRIRLPGPSLHQTAQRSCRHFLTQSFQEKATLFFEHQQKGALLHHMQIYARRYGSHESWTT